MFIFVSAKKSKTYIQKMIMRYPRKHYSFFHSNYNQEIMKDFSFIFLIYLPIRTVNKYDKSSG